MGPEATVLLMQKIIANVEAEDDSDHIPMIVHQNTQVPSRIFSILESRGEDPSLILQKMALDLEHLQCDFLAMPCNTAHYYYSDISKSVQIPVLNMVEIAVKKLLKKHLKKIAVLASPAVKAVGVFDHSLRSNGLEFQFAHSDITMLNMIKTIKRGGVDELLIDAFRFEVNQLLDHNCDGILIACTELSLLSKYLTRDIPCVDSLDSLTKEIVLMAMDTETMIPRAG
jgi:aspartate racemase